MKRNLFAFLTTVLIIGGTFAQTNYVLNFNGTSDYVDIGSNAGNGIRTIEFWFKPGIVYDNTLSVPASFITRNTADVGNIGSFAIFIGPGSWPGYEGKLVFGNNGAANDIMSNSANWTAGAWYHVACIFDPATGMKMYIDGILQSDTNTYTNPTDTRTEITAFGKWGDYDARYFNGAMDEVRFWTRALSQSEVQQKMCLTLNPSAETGLVGYWRMNEGTGTIIHDSTTNGYNGTITGATFSNENYCFAGISENISEFSLTIYPNPFNSFATIQFDKVSNSSQISIYNTFGQEVKTIKNISSDKLVIDRENLRGGIYTLRLTENDRIIKTEKLIITD